MNIGLIVLLVVVAWSILSIVAAVAIGAMAHARDTGPAPLLETTLAENDARDETKRATG